MNEIFPDQARLAYLAGFFDGEGHVSLRRHSTKKRYKNGTVRVYDRVSLQVSASQNTREPLNLFQEEFGGSLTHVRAKRSYDAGLYNRWNWVVSTAAAVVAIKLMRPYLVVKASQADLALAFAETVSKSCGRHGHGPEMMAKRTEMAVKMKELRADVRRQVDAYAQ